MILSFNFLCVGSLVDFYNMHSLQISSHPELSSLTITISPVIPLLFHTLLTVLPYALNTIGTVYRDSGSIEGYLQYLLSVFIYLLIDILG